MKTRSLNRRQVLRAATLTASVGAISVLHAAAKSKGVVWPIGCLNRAWAKWPSEVALAGIRAAGYRLAGLLSNHVDNPLALPDATVESLAALRKKLATNGLEANLTALRYNASSSSPDIEASVRAQLDHAQAIGVGTVMTFGTDRPENYERYLRLMKQTAAWAADRRLQLVLKPHGGISASAAELERCLDRVGHANFKLWYDAGNILHYTGKDPVTELKSIAKHVTGFCAKDCVGRGGEVMLQFGLGQVDFPGVFAVLKAAGFHGPVMVEGVKVGSTPEETTANARANREFLEKVLAST